MKLPSNPAALGALARGDFKNMMVAATPGGIEAQEAQGQREFCASTTLPKECRNATPEQLEAIGFKFGAAVDDLFVHATLPPGWSKKATEHNMYNDLLDEQGRKRGGIFYKAAFYDRRAEMDMRARFIIDPYSPATSEHEYAVVVRDWDDSVIHMVGQYRRDNYQGGMFLRTEAELWLKGNHSGYADVFASWD